MGMKIWDTKNNCFVSCREQLMVCAGFNSGHKYKDIGVMSDGDSVVFDTCGNFGYLDPQRFKVVFLIGDI